MTTPSFPPAGSDQELEVFEALQRGFGSQFRDVFPDRGRWQTVVVVPSMSVDVEIAEKIQGARHYEERMLFMLMLLRQPRTRIVYVTSQAIDPAIVDYYLHLLPGVPSGHARQRLVLLNCHDGSPQPLTEKVLGRRRLLERVRAEVHDPEATHLICYNVTPLERTLAVRLGLPLYGCDPALWHLGTKSGNREIFREAGVRCADGRENLKNAEEVAAALVELKTEHPGLKHAVVKLNEGISGGGNARFSFAGCPQGEGLAEWVRRELPQRLAYEAPGETWAGYMRLFEQQRGVVECFLEAKAVRSPSVQGLIDPLGQVTLVSTHDQVLGGPSGQIYLGCTFPADGAYRLAIQAEAAKAARVLAERGVWGRFAVDFLSLDRGQGWEHYAIEINVRRGGTTYPYMMLQFLTDGRYNAETGLFETPTGQTRCYHASDNLKKDAYRGLTPEDLITLLVENGLSYHGVEQQGVVFHLIGALSEFGKLGILCVADQPARAAELFDQAVAVLDREAERNALAL